MTIQAQYLVTSRYLQATLRGEWTEPGIKAALDDVRAEADVRGFKTLLLDLDGLSRPDCEMTRFFSGECPVTYWAAFCSGGIGEARADKQVWRDRRSDPSRLFCSFCRATASHRLACGGSWIGRS
jgi:hypothetical protein